MAPAPWLAFGTCIRPRVPLGLVRFAPKFAPRLEPGRVQNALSAGQKAGSFCEDWASWTPAVF